MNSGSSIWRSIFSILWKILLFVVLLLAVATHWLADSFIFRPPPVSYEADYRYFAVQTENNEAISCRFLSNKRSKYLVIYSHGNAEDLGLIEPLLKGYQRAGLNVLAYDYPGYGLSSGKPTEESTYRAIDAVTDLAIQKLGFAPESIVFHGRSMGAGPSIEMCRRGNYGGLIVESAFTSAFDVVLGKGLFPWDRYQNLKKIREVDESTFVIHGFDDTVIPIEHGKRLFEASTAPKLYYWIEGGGHNNLQYLLQTEYWDILSEFVLYIDQDL